MIGTIIVSAIYVSGFIATVEAVNLETALVGYGPLGAICLWFMYRDVKKDDVLQGVKHTLVGLEKALLLDVIARPIDEPTREIARGLLAKAEARK